jgi:hypothetical protein
MSWSDGTRAFASNASFTWACHLSGGDLALVDEENAVLWRWHPQDSRRTSFAALSILRRPVQCAQRGDVLYVACFGEEGEAGRSGIALIHAASWRIVGERPLGTHIHHTYPLPGGGPLIFADVGDPWVTPPVLGGLYHVDSVLSHHAPAPRRIGEPMHARAVTLPETPGRGKKSRGGGELPTRLHAITQEPLGRPTRVVSLENAAGWGGTEALSAASEFANATVVGILELPRPASPSDGGADIFAIGDRLFATDRYAGPGRLFELSSADAGENAGGGLHILASVPLGVHPRYTDPLGSDGTSGGGTDAPPRIYSVSRDDGMLTALDARTLDVVAQQPVNVPMPCFAIRWRGGTGTGRDREPSASDVT